MLNVFLLAPVWLQLVHLVVADLVWIGLILLGASVLARPATSFAVGGPISPAPRHPGAVITHAS
jgi:hypothetical protein